MADTSHPTPLRVLLVGCGNIAGGFDAARPDGAWPLTHAGALRRHGGFTIDACIEPDAARREAFAQRWAVPRGVPDFDALGPGGGRFDIVAICSPTALHGEHLAGALRLAPQLIFCEKPLTPSLADSELWVSRCAEAGVLLAVNHTRRWAPDVMRLAEELAAGAWGTVRAACAIYNKGVLNNGGHMVDLLHALLGPLDVIAAGAPVWDFWPDDPSVPALLRSHSGVSVTLNVGHAADYALFELQLVTQCGTIMLEDGGQAWRQRRVVDSAQFSRYRTLEVGERRAGEYEQAMSRAVANLHRALQHGEALAGSGEGALQAQRVCHELRRRALDMAAAPAHGDNTQLRERDRT